MYLQMLTPFPPSAETAKPKSANAVIELSYYTLAPSTFDTEMSLDFVRAVRVEWKEDATVYNFHVLSDEEVTTQQPPTEV